MTIEASCKMVLLAQADFDGELDAAQAAEMVSASGRLRGGEAAYAELNAPATRCATANSIGRARDAGRCSPRGRRRGRPAAPAWDRVVAPAGGEFALARRSPWCSWSYLCGDSRA